MGGVVNISAPYILDPERVLVSGVLILEDIEISIKPETYKVAVLTGGPILPIIPLGQGNDYDRQQHNLLVTLQFITTASGLSLTPKNTLLEIDGVATRPTHSSDTFLKTNPPREAQSAPPGHKWICEGRAAMLNEVLVDTELAIESRGCIVMEFPVKTPDTDMQFNIEVRGLKKDGIPILVPKFYFKPGTTIVTSIMG